MVPAVPICRRSFAPLFVAVPDRVRTAARACAARAAPPWGRLGAPLAPAAFELPRLRVCREGGEALAPWPFLPVDELAPPVASPLFPSAALFANMFLLTIGLYCMFMSPGSSPRSVEWCLWLARILSMSAWFSYLLTTPRHTSQPMLRSCTTPGHWWHTATYTTEVRRPRWSCANPTNTSPSRTATKEAHRRLLPRR